jgi:hypothetical protein
MALSNLQILNYVWSREIPTRALAEVAENRQVALKKPRTPSRAQGTLPKIKGLVYSLLAADFSSCIRLRIDQRNIISGTKEILTNQKYPVSPLRYDGSYSLCDFAKNKKLAPSAILRD